MLPQLRERKMPSPKAETEWRALPNQRGPLWHVLDPIDNEIIARNLTEAQARLIAAAPAKEKLCKELADALEEATDNCARCGGLGLDDNHLNDPGPCQLCRNWRAALTKAGRAPG